MHLTGKTDKFTAVDVPRQCSLVPLVKLDLRGRKTFGSGEGRAMRSVARRETEQALTAFDWSFDVNMRDLIQVIPYLNIHAKPQRKPFSVTEINC
jgi:hypothetical protein